MTGQIDMGGGVCLLVFVNFNLLLLSLLGFCLGLVGFLFGWFFVVCFLFCFVLFYVMFMCLFCLHFHPCFLFFQHSETVHPCNISDVTYTQRSWLHMMKISILHRQFITWTTDFTLPSLVNQLPKKSQHSKMNKHIIFFILFFSLS